MDAVEALRMLLDGAFLARDACSKASIAWPVLSAHTCPAWASAVPACWAALPPKPIHADPSSRNLSSSTSCQVYPSSFSSASSVPGSRNPTVASPQRLAQAVDIGGADGFSRLKVGRGQVEPVGMAVCKAAV